MRAATGNYFKKYSEEVDARRYFEIDQIEWYKIKFVESKYFTITLEFSFFKHNNTYRIDIIYNKLYALSKLTYVMRRQ